MMEELKMKQDVEHELKNNKICQQSDAIDNIEDKFKKRMMYMTNNMLEKRKENRKILSKFLREHDKHLAMLELDEDQLARAEHRAEWGLDDADSADGHGGAAEAGSPHLRQGQGAPRPTAPLYTLGIEKFLNHIQPDRYVSTSPTKPTAADPKSSAAASEPAASLLDIHARQKSITSTSKSKSTTKKGKKSRQRPDRRDPNKM